MTRSKVERLMKAFGKIWSEKENKDKDELSNIMITKLLKKEKNMRRKNYIAYLDYANVMAIIPKKEALSKLIANNFIIGKTRDFESIKPFLKPYISKSTKEQITFYAPELLELISNLTRIYDTNIKIKSHRDFPLWVETDDFICILAPRIPPEEQAKNGK